MVTTRKHLWDNKCQKIYHQSKYKYKHQSDEWMKVFKHEFIELCINDGLVRDFKDIIKPAPTASLY